MSEMIASIDENNNRPNGQIVSSKNEAYVERHLELCEHDFLIIPNGGSGDCMFKAVAQAVYHGDESRHKEIRSKVVDFIISHKWEKFSESIEVQHINGNNLLQRQWAKNPKHTYKMYMNLSGTLGSSSELTAAGELFQYNFATIQEYCNSTGRTYRVENCILCDSIPNFHYFYFTGDYDNGHWEYIQNLSNVRTEDGTYQGRHKTIISGEEITIEEWLAKYTANKNDPDHLKIPTNRLYFVKRRSIHPFEINCFRFGKRSIVTLNSASFTIANVECTDLFTVLAQECLHNEESADEAELVLMKHRYTYFEEVNYKLITQPLSHNFSIEAIKYCGYPCKGNIQDLISAADLYSFSFILYLKLTDANNDEVHECKFTHVDRWGGESDRILYFFMRLSRVDSTGEILSKWWRLIPNDQSGVGSSHSSQTKIGKKSKQGLLVSSEEKMTTWDSIVDSKVAILKSSRPDTPSAWSECSVKPQESSVQHLKEILEVSEAILGPRLSTQKSYSTQESYPGGLTIVEDGDQKPTTGLKKDYEKIFGGDDISSSILPEKQSRLQNGETRLVKKKGTKENLKPATGIDLLKHPERVKTVVKVSDSHNSGREIIYRGDGYMEAHDVLTDLGTQGLIKLPSSPSNAKSQAKESKVVIKQFQNGEKIYFERPTVFLDENFNFIDKDGPGVLKRREEDQESEISFEKFGPGAFDENVQNVEPKRSLELREKSFLSSEFVLNGRYDHSKTRRNKVAPTHADISQNYMNRRCSFANTEQRYQYNDRSESNSCFSQLMKVFHWISLRIRKLTQRTQRGFQARYERYRASTTLFSVSKSQFPANK